jgi:hypothetical protein
MPDSIPSTLVTFEEEDYRYFIYLPPSPKFQLAINAKAHSFAT